MSQKLKIIHSGNEAGWSVRGYATDNDLLNNPYAMHHKQGKKISIQTMDEIFNYVNNVNAPHKSGEDFAYPEAEAILEDECKKRFPGYDPSVL